MPLVLEKDTDAFLKVSIKGMGKPTYEPLLRDIGAQKIRGQYSWKLPNYRMYVLFLLDIFPDTIIDEYIQKVTLESEFGFRVVWKGLKPGGWQRLKPYQSQGARYLQSSPKRGSMLAFLPGLGKTATAVMGVLGCEFENVLVIAPRILAQMWVREFDEWGKIEAKNLYWADGEEGIVISTYETVRNRAESYSIPWDLIIVDESTRMINAQSVTSKQLLKIRKRSGYVWCLTGTPIRKFMDDLWGQFRFMDPQSFKSYWRFANRFCHTEDNGWGTQIIGSKSMDFKHQFADLMLTAGYEDLEEEVPEIEFDLIETELLPAQRSAFDELLEDFITYLEDGTKIQVKYIVAQIIRLQQITSNLINVGGPDESAKADRIVDLIGTGVRYPMIIWVHFRPGAEALYNRIKDRVKTELVLGGHPDPDEVIERYKAGKVDVLIISITMGKFGLHLINTHTVLYLDKTFSMEAYIQSLYRVHRMGSTHSPKVISIRAPDTTDSLVEDNLRVKADDIGKLSQEELIMLLRSLQNENHSH